MKNLFKIVIQFDRASQFSSPGEQSSPCPAPQALLPRNACPLPDTYPTSYNEQKQTNSIAHFTYSPFKGKILLP
jgi:hypothetical protein